ncbi:MAG: type IX secretion system protein PorQ [Bacteroidales bacterium]|nr:type IX secretion system protein PorQ [Bacteroidales bacterium]
MKKSYILILSMVLAAHCGHAQIAGNTALSALNLVPNARTAGLGMSYLSVFDNDINVAWDNPSYTNVSMHNHLSINFINHFAGTNYGSVAYGRTFEKFGSYIFGLQYVNYGKFARYDEAENEDGTFHAADYVFHIGWGRALDSNFYIGVNFRPVLSQYDYYTALALSFDLAGSYVNNSKSFSATFIARNVGAQIVTFSGAREKLPFELSAGLSYKLKKAPFRFYLSANELQKWNLRYSDTLNPTYTIDPFTGERTDEKAFKGFIDNFFRHLDLGVEFCPGNAFKVWLGYSYRQSKEMQAADITNMSGFSYGVGLRVKRINIGYSRNNYHLGQAPNTISVSTNLENFLKH